MPQKIKPLSLWAKEERKDNNKFLPIPQNSNHYPDCEIGYNQIIAGVDEVGRGPLAGPVVASAVILPEYFEFKLFDSKSISLNKRLELYDLILQKAVSVTVSFVPPQIIDSVNIRRATFIAMRNAVLSLSVKPELVLVDGRDIIPGIEIKQKAIIKGDSKFDSISAASIVAKVARDKYMESISDYFPSYKFQKHKGYPTKFHYTIIQKYGPCVIHRKSFKGVVR